MRTLFGTLLCCTVSTLAIGLCGCQNNIATTTADTRSGLSTATAATSTSFPVQASTEVGATGATNLSLVWPDVAGAYNYVIRVSSDPTSADCSAGLISSVDVLSSTDTVTLSATAAGICILAVNSNGDTLATSYYKLPTVAPVAAALVLSDVPKTMVAGTSPAKALTVTVVDASGHAVADATASISLSAASDSKCATPVTSGFTAATAAVTDGYATFKTLAATKSGPLYLKATAAGLTSACAGPLTITPAPPASLSLLSSPNGPGYAGHALTVVAQARDVFGNGIPNVALSVTATGGGACSGCSAQTDSTGTLSVVWTLGAAIGASNTLTFTAGSLAPLQLTLPALNFYCDQAPTAGIWQAGSGTQQDPYVICSAAQLAQIGVDPVLLTQSFRLEHDIDLSAYDASTAALHFPMIGSYDIAAVGSAVGYSGTFDGNGHTIDHLILGIGAATKTVGLFSYTSGATIKNLTMTNASVTNDGTAFAAILIGEGLNTAVDHVQLSGVLTATQGNQQGAFFGRGEAIAGTSSLTNSSTSVALAASDTSGGINGMTHCATGGTFNMSHLTASGAITQGASGNSYGGAFGYIFVEACQVNIDHVVSSGSVTATVAGSFSGGFLGTAYVSGVLNISDILETGNLSTPLDFFIARTEGGDFAGNLTVMPGGQINVARVGATGWVHDTNTTNLTGNVGGFIGIVYTNAGSNSGTASVTITDSYATGAVTLTAGNPANEVSSFVGVVSMTYPTVEAVTLTRVYASGTVTGPTGTTVGGLVGVGQNTGSSLTFVNDHWNSDAVASGYGTNSGQAGMTGSSLANLKNQSTYTGWDFSTVWQANAGGLPTLR